MRWILALLSLLPASTQQVVEPPATVRDARTAPYYEDAVVPRPIAEVAVELAGCGERAFVRLTVSALGSAIDALPGIEGAPGANLRTAEELERLLREQALHLVTRVDGRSILGTLVGVEWGHVPNRRIAADGGIDFGSSTPSRWPVRIVFESAVLPMGETWCYLEADGVPRLAVQTSPHRLLAIESRGARGQQR